jgi:prevent-host-death family protein
MTVKSISVSGVGRKLKDILAVLDETGRPYFITRRNRPKAVLVRYEDYSALVEQARERGPRIIRRPEISGGEPIIQGTRISVRHIVERVRAGQSVEDILAALPHLTTAQVYAALAYYYEYKPEIDRLIEESQPERIIAAHGLKVEKVADGVAIVRGDAGR